MFANGRIWLAYLIVFASSACTLVIELIAGRIMAPYIGVSLYTWTSIIGIVLAGMSLGNYLGGLAADRRPSRRTLGLIFLAAGIASLGILVVTDLVVVARIPLSLLPRIVVYTTAIFFLPSLALGMVSPVVVKLTLADLTRTGNTVGTLYAVSTVGSIFGTFFTGFWLISWLGTRMIVWVVGGILLLIGLVVGDFLRPRRGLGLLVLAALGAAVAFWLDVSGAVSGLAWRAADLLALPAVVSGPVLILAGGLFRPRIAAGSGGVAVAIVALVGLGWNIGLYRAPCRVESDYFCIRVSQTLAGGHSAHALILDRLIHSYVVLDDPSVLGYGYERAYAELTQMHAAGRQELETLFIGGGGYAFPRYVEAAYPRAGIDVIEIDPAVTRAAYEHLGLSPATRIRTFNHDARAFLLEWADPKRYDIIYGDAFNDLSVPYHLTTVEFNRMIATRLKPDGIYVANVIDRLADGEFLKAYANALRRAFPHVDILTHGEAGLPFDRNTYVLLAGRRPLDRARLDATTSSDPSLRTVPLPAARLEAYLRSGRALVLTDDFAPVDQLLATLFVERGSEP
jgi:spermidine synthase